MILLRIMNASAQRLARLSVSNFHKVDEHEIILQESLPGVARTQHGNFTLP